jgi:cation:H+ antiporter
MLLFIASIVVGLIVLVWSADKFIDGASNVARFYGVSPLIIGMVIIGFGTSAPEMVVSVMSAMEGNPGIALGNAYGSNITNIALILGLTAILVPITVNSQVIKKELPILLLITIISVALVYDLEVSRIDAIIMLVLFLGLMIWTTLQGLKAGRDALAQEVESELTSHVISIRKSYFYLVMGLILLIISSRLLVYGAVGVATAMGVSEVIVGLTVVAIGTSLPELASSYIAARKGESDMALGNVIGSNLFNTLAVVGLAGVISPMSFEKEIFSRDIMLMSALTVLLFLFSFGFKGINRYKGAIFFISYIAYIAYLVKLTLGVSS